MSLVSSPIDCHWFLSVSLLTQLGGPIKHIGDLDFCLELWNPLLLPDIEKIAHQCLAPYCNVYTSITKCLWKEDQNFTDWPGEAKSASYIWSQNNLHLFCGKMLEVPVMFSKDHTGSWITIFHWARLSFAVQCSAVQCSTVQFSAMQCSAVQCSAEQCRTVQFSAM